jgi:hypothetical protein
VSCTQVLAKCGQINVHHWAHVVGEDCDPWSEPETPWHRKWKSFGHLTEQTLANHRADIITSRGLVVELQHSGISVDEIREREAFYGANLRWLFDGTDLPVGTPSYNLLCSETSYDVVRDREEPYIDPVHGPCTLPRIRVLETPYGRIKQAYYSWEDPPWVDTGRSARLCLRNREGKRSKEGWEVVTFRWLHPRKHYVAARIAYIDLPGNFILKLGKLHLEGGPPYGGWGLLVPRATVEGWLR